MEYKFNLLLCPELRDAYLLLLILITVAPALIELSLIEPPALIEPRSASQVKHEARRIFFPPPKPEITRKNGKKHQAFRNTRFWIKIYSQKMHLLSERTS